MVLHRESDVIEEGEMSEYQNSCCVILIMVLAEEAALREGVSIIGELRGCGDIFPGCVCLIDLFRTLEEAGILDTSNGLHMFSLQYIFLTRINHQLRLFQESYSHHRLRTAGNLSPLQLSVRGLAMEAGGCCSYMVYIYGRQMYY